MVSALLAPNSSRDLVYIASNDVNLEAFEKQLRFFQGQDENYDVLKLWAWDCLPYDRSSPSSAIINERIRCLYQLANRKKKTFVITSVNAVLQKILPPKKVQASYLILKKGETIAPDQINRALIENGYERVTTASLAGEFAQRGGIIDLVISSKIAHATGYRIDFFGNVIESIRAFDPLTQIAQEHFKQIEILPASEVILSADTIANFRKNYLQNFGVNSDDQFYSTISQGEAAIGMEHWLPFFYDNTLATLFDYLNSPIIIADKKILELAKAQHELIAENYRFRKADQAYRPVRPESMFVTEDELESIFAANQVVWCTTPQPSLRGSQSEPRQSSAEFEQSWIAASPAAQASRNDELERNLGLEITSIPDFALNGREAKQDPILLMRDFINQVKGESPQIKIAIACSSEPSRDRISKLLADFDIKSTSINTYAELTNNQIGLIIMPAKSGFRASDLLLIGEQALFGERMIRQTIPKNNLKLSQKILEESFNINPGDIVVHRTHGIARFDGIYPIESNSVKHDFLKLIYANDDALFVPVEHINLITRYASSESQVTLDRLGGSAFKARKDKVKKTIQIAAKKLIEIAAARKLGNAPILTPNPHLYEEFKARFPFSETEDQLKAIAEVEEDLASNKPMDRLICGDVGFGKTEVAMRAGFIAAANKSKPYQVAILTPTTLLSRQHYQNFTKRFEGIDIKIKQLSRMVSPADVKKIQAEINSGEANIIIGTHALLNKNIHFANLGLVIIDEEQHFGVAQKERMKELRSEAHILSLSATPIPRTLQMSLSGIKDLSLIATPPADRLAVRNFVLPYDPMVIREAVMREYNRGGQCFFVVPRVADLADTRERLAKIVPEIKIAVAHGRTSPKELDKIMNDFVDAKFDLLLSTTIIESGIDITTANTIIIYKAQSFGLAQLYQLRGRVGRGKVRGYAYFMHENTRGVGRRLRKDARLDAMQKLDNLGVGFNVASYDLDIRGSGNLLGDEQSGHLKDTGAELYQQLLLEAVTELKSGKSPTEVAATPEEDYQIQIKLGISLLIPKNYIEDLSLRLYFYKKIASVANEEDQQKLSGEMENRYGALPTEVNNLMEIAKLIALAKEIGIEKLELLREGIAVSFKNNQFKASDALLKLVFSSGGKIKLYTGQKILFTEFKPEAATKDKIKNSFSVINKLRGLL